MRDEMTMSLMGPLPRSHSPAPVARSLSFIVASLQLPVARSEGGSDGASPSKRQSCFLRLTDLVAQLGGALIIFAFDSALKLLAELGGIEAFAGRDSSAAT